MTVCTINIRQYLGRHISDICSNGYHNNSDNHCAHFVSHILGFRFGFKCRHMTGKGEQTASASIRVHEVFTRCPQVGKWGEKPSNLSFCLAFVTSASNVNLATKVMTNHPRKHVGIFLNGKVYHYSNSRNIIVEQTPEVFAKHYSGSDIAVYYGTLPV